MSIVIPDQKSLWETMGVSLIGVLLAAILYGVTFLQVLYYFVFTVPEMPEDRKDRWPLKTLVLAVFIFDTIHMALISHTGNLLLPRHSLRRSVCSGKLCLESASASKLEVLFNGLIALLVQSFLTVRVWRLSESKLLAGVAFLLVIAEFVTSPDFYSRILSSSTNSLQPQAFAINGLIHVKTFEDLTTMKGLSVTVNILAVVSDLYIALALCCLLYSSKTGYHKSDTIVRKLSIYALNTGLITSACALASFISITAAPTTFIYIMFFFCIGRLYANSLLASLNMRNHVRQLAQNVRSGSSFWDDVKFASMESSGVARGNRNPVSVQVESIRSQHYDSEGTVVTTATADSPTTTMVCKCQCCRHVAAEEKKVLGEVQVQEGFRKSQSSFSIHLSDIAEEDSDGTPSVGCVDGSYCQRCPSVVGV
ncbi:hypothetical protein L218DRAFT_1007813 [Marasmius fiardii PR-910]|nr:hypothetical protein L218DRAFT_1007813 [Marasmius fiardii PR-910]